MAFWVYLLRCRDQSVYVGHTDDLERRLAQHISGACGGFTATRLPVEPIWVQEFDRRVEALETERQIKDLLSLPKGAGAVPKSWPSLATTGMRSSASHEAPSLDAGGPSTPPPPHPWRRLRSG